MSNLFTDIAGTMKDAPQLGILVSGLILILLVFLNWQTFPPGPNNFFEYVKIIILIIGICFVIYPTYKESRKGLPFEVTATVKNSPATSDAPHMISNTPPPVSNDMKTPQRYRPECDFVVNSKADVLQRVSVLDYGEHANKLASLPETQEIFTLCVFEPVKICKMVIDIINEREHNSDMNMEKLVKMEEQEFLAEVDTHLYHFKTFREYRQKKSHNIYRILVLNDKDYNKRNSYEMFQKFCWLNGNIECQVAFRDALSQITIFLTDYVIINDNIIIDYYEDSAIMILTCTDKDSKECTELLHLKTHYKTHMPDKRFTELRKFVKVERDNKNLKDYDEMTAQDA